MAKFEDLSKEDQEKLKNFIKPHLKFEDLPGEEQEKAGNPWAGWRPSTKKFDPNDPKVDPMHPREGTPKELLEEIWGETYD